MRTDQWVLDRGWGWGRQVHGLLQTVVNFLANEAVESHAPLVILFIDLLGHTQLGQSEAVSLWSHIVAVTSPVTVAVTFGLQFWCHCSPVCLTFNLRQSTVWHRVYC